MTDRYYALTVALEKNIRADDAADIIKSIKMIKGVANVKGNVANPETWMAEERARMLLSKRIIDILYDVESR